MRASYANKILNCAIVFAAVILIISPFLSFAYSDETTHPALTQEIIDFYNLSYPQNKLTDEQKEWVIRGSINEDIWPRWINHFYDPVEKEGWTGEHAGSVPQQAVNIFSRAGLSFEKPLSAVEWSKNYLIQEEYSRYGGNRTWKKALEYYAGGNLEEAYVTLGHILHLLEDMSVPEHTRNDSHAEVKYITDGDSSPFEAYLSKWDRNNIRDLEIIPNLQKNKLGPIEKSSLENYLISLAEYSNRYFFSKDTINDPKYTNPKIVRVDEYWGYGIDENGIQFPLVKIRREWNTKTNSFTYFSDISNKPEYYPILDAYFSHLAPKVVLNGAGLINLFKKQGEEEKVKKEYPSRLVKFDTSAFTIPTFSVAAEFKKILEAGSKFIAQIGNAINKDFDAVYNFFAGFLRSNEEFKSAGQAEIRKEINNPPAQIKSAQDQNNAVYQNNPVLPTNTNNQKNQRAAYNNNVIFNSPVNSGNRQITFSRGAKINGEENKVIGNKLKEEEINNSPEAPDKSEGKNDDGAVKTVESAALSTTPPIQKQCDFNSAQAPSRQKIIFNEIAWMGGTESVNDEWLELKNISDSEVSLNNWQITDKAGDIKIVFEQSDKIPAGQFYLLERTDDNSVSGAAAQKIYTGSLANTSESIKIFNERCDLMDEVSADPNWPAGDNVSKKTMERDRSGFGWHTSFSAGGTPKNENSVPALAFGGGGGAMTIANRRPTAENPPPPAKILISEIQITAGSGKTENDFIELYNPNDSAVNLNGYRLVKRTKNGVSDISIKSWTSDIFIPAKNYYLWANSGYSDIEAVPDAITSAAVADHNGIALRFGPEDSGTIIDSVAWGETENGFAETQIFPQNPGAHQSLERKISGDNLTDTQNNANDFQISFCPSPRARSRSCGAGVNQAPSAFFVFAPLNPKTNEPVVFDASSSTDPDGIISFYEWDFGDGQVVSSTEKIIAHSFVSPADFNVRLTIFDNENSTGSASSTIAVLRSQEKILISEVLFDAEDNDLGREFVELYNPTESQIDLSGWSLREVEGEATSSDSVALIGVVPQENVKIASRGFFLIGLASYNASNYGNKAADIWRTNSLPNGSKETSLILLDKEGAEIDRLTYDKNSIEKSGQSLERKVKMGAECFAADNLREFDGNDCDTGAKGDFAARSSPNPQNSLSLPEPRTPPAPPQISRAEFNRDTASIDLEWLGNEASASYEIRENSPSSSVLGLTPSSTFSARVLEVNSSHTYYIRALDRDGLGSEFASGTAFAPGFFDEFSFYRESPEADNFFIEAHYNRYPFVPRIWQGGWKLLVFYLNSEPPPVRHIEYGFGPVNLDNHSSFKYRNCAGGSSPVDVLLLPDSIYYCGIAGGAFNSAAALDLVENNHFIFEIFPGGNFNSENPSENYLTIAFYDTLDTWRFEGRIPSFGLVAVDKNRYFLREFQPLLIFP